MSNRLLVLLNAFLSFAIGLLGLSSCHRDSGDDDKPCEYGVPHADYSVEGFVFDEGDTPIEGITIKFGSFREAYSNVNDTVVTEFVIYDSIKTCREGKYCTKLVSSDEPGKLRVITTDDNGVYASDTLVPKKAEKIGKGDGVWYSGKFKYRQDIHLKKK